MDIILVTKAGLIENVVVHQPSSASVPSDHYLITFVLLLPDRTSRGGNIAQPVEVFNYSKADWISLCNYLLDEDFSVCYDSQCVEEVWSVLKLILNEAMPLFIPKVVIRKKQLPVPP